MNLHIALWLALVAGNLVLEATVPSFDGWPGVFDRSLYQWVAVLCCALLPA